MLGGKDILKQTPDDNPTHGGCAILLPYAGRVRNGEYTYEGKSYSLPKNSEGNAIHGFLKDTNLEIKRSEASLIEMSTSLAHSGYTTTLGVMIQYELSDTRLSVSIRTTNTGKRESPLSIGFHPYFLGKSWELEHNCSVERLEMEDNYFPDGRTLSVDFNRKKLEKEKFDDCFSFPCDAHLVTDQIKLGISKRSMPYTVLFNGKWAEGKSVAFEPYTSAPDAFNNGIGLIHLAGGKSFECGFTIELSS